MILPMLTASPSASCACCFILHIKSSRCASQISHRCTSSVHCQIRRRGVHTVRAVQPGRLSLAIASQASMNRRTARASSQGASATGSAGCLLRLQAAQLRDAAAQPSSSPSPRWEDLLGFTKVGSSFGGSAVGGGPTAAAAVSVLTPCFWSAQSAESKNLWSCVRTLEHASAWVGR